MFKSDYYFCFLLLKIYLHPKPLAKLKLVKPPQLANTDSLKDLMLHPMFSSKQTYFLELAKKGCVSCTYAEESATFARRLQLHPLDTLR